jgi:Flagellar hook-length control protein FliK
MNVVTALPPPPVPVAPPPGAQLVLQPGTVVNALVLQLLDQGQVRLAVANTLIDVLSQVPLTPGTTVRLAVEGTPAEPRLVVVEQGASAGVRPEAAARPTAVAGGETLREVRAPTPGNQAALPSSEAKPQPPSVAALMQAVPSAAARQSGLGPLFANLAAAADLDLLPAPVRQAAAPVLALQTPLQPNISATDLKQAFARSGLLMEARLAADAATGTATPAQTVPDLKAALTVLRQALATWVEAVSPPQAAAQGAPSAQSGAAAPANQAAPSPASPPPDGAGEGDVAMPSGSGMPAPAGSAKVPAQGSAQVPAPAGVVKPPAHVPAPPSLAEEVADAAPSLPARATAPTGQRPDALLEATPRPRIPLPTPSLPLAFSLPASRVTPAHAEPGEARMMASTQEATAAPPPPYRGAPPAPQPPVTPTITALTAPHVVAEALRDETDAALARQTLLQAASLPDRAEPQAQRSEASGPRWNFEIPFATPQGTAIAQFEIARDGHQAQRDGAAPGWRVRFTLDVEPMGPVHAQIGLTGVRASVNLWAERGTSAAQLRAQAALLRDGLKAAEFEPGDVVVRTGAPPQPAAAVGRFMDRAS